MRSGACTVQQTLTAEAASILKHSLSLARRRGHAQVTPLHVAATLLSSRSSLLRRACLKSQPNYQSSHHPLQCRALELCFNVALNRLPTTPGPLLHGQPSLSNALIAALKRAQAHQRRGCIEQNQQQPLLTIKVELEQLIISILDDPSVSRVMREAGFSSTAVKNNLEDSSTSSVFQCYSSTGNGGVFSSPCSPSPPETNFQNPSSFWQTHFPAFSMEKNPFLFSPQKRVLSNYFGADSVREDIKLVLEVFLRKKRKNTVIVGDCVSITEGVVNELMGRVERGEVPIELKKVQFVRFQFAPVSLRLMNKQDVEMNISQLKRKVDSIGENGGAIIYTGDLKWTVVEEEEKSFVNNSGEEDYYSPVEHLVAEIGKLVSEYSNSKSNVWLMATSTYQTYMKCQMRQPPLEFQWALQAVSVPSGGQLGLSLHNSSIHESKIRFSHNPSQVLETKHFIFSNGKDESYKLSCCPKCASNYEKEAQFLKSVQNKNLPPWLHPQGINSNQKDELIELRRKWNGICSGLNHQGKNHLGSTNLVEKTNSSNPWWSTQNNILEDSNSISLTTPKFRRQQSCTIDFNFDHGIHKNQPNLDSLKNTQGKDVKITLALGNSFLSGIGESDKGKKNDLCKLLKENIPWQSEVIIHSIAEALVESESAKKGTWLLLQGNDLVGKRKLALSVAEFVLGSASSLLYMNMRKTDNEATSFFESLRNHEKFVALVEDVDISDTQFLKLLSDAFERGKFGESVNVDQGIFFLTRSSSDLCYEDGRTNKESVIQMTLEVKANKLSRFCSPNMDHHKRKSEWECSGKIKNPRMNEKEDGEIGKKIKKDFSRQSSFNSTLDLNIKANEDEEESEEKHGEFSPVSSDLTRETNSDPVSPHGFLDSIKNCVHFDKNEGDDRVIKEVISSKLNSTVEEVFIGDQNGIGFSIEERVLQEIVDGYGYFVNSQMERWLKDIFRKTLETVKSGGKKGNMGIRLCFEGKYEKNLENGGGFMGSCLPKKIQVCVMD